MTVEAGLELLRFIFFDVMPFVLGVVGGIWIAVSIVKEYEK